MQSFQDADYKFLVAYAYEISTIATGSCADDVCRQIYKGKFLSNVYARLSVLLPTCSHSCKICDTPSLHACMVSFDMQATNESVHLMQGKTQLHSSLIACS